jgi:Fe-S-cluster-containing dehydrogenase component
MNGIRMLIDTSKCIGCKACQIACQQWHSLPAEDTSFTGSYQNPPDMSGANLSVAKFTEVEDAGKVKWLFFKDMCRHCEIPRCFACPLGAVTKMVGGPVRIDPLKCDPHRCSTNPVKPCQFYCPYNIPKFNYKKNGMIVETVARKCDFCVDRFTHPDLPVASKKPACVATCPPGIIKIANADAALTYAIRRAKILRNRGYPNATVYPHQSTTWGATRVIWIILDKASVYGLPGRAY